MGTKQRAVASVRAAVETHEGEGFLVHRPFPVGGLMQVDPFLLLDEMGPADLAPGEAKGAPDHPHRGFETVTYMLAGAMRHRDSAGNEGRLGPGDVQWMTAGAGVVHSELPDPQLLRDGGRMHGFQLWVNLPRRDKMTPPRYQEIPAARIPTVTSADGTVTARVIAGEALGAKAVIETRTPILYVHYTLSAGARVEQAVPDGFNAMAYVVRGSVRSGGRDARRADLVMFAREGGPVVLEATEPADVLVLAGQPLDEPVVRYGPFVMNAPEEIQQAFDDYRSGRMGRIGA